MTDFDIRPAREADLEAINDIYNHYVLTSTATYQITPETMDSRLAWFESHDARRPILIAERDGNVLGWASLSRFHPREAYDATVEDSLYIRPEHHRRGIGLALLGRLLELGRLHEYRTVIAAIDSEQAPSIALHERCGFTPAGTLKDVGRKFGRWLDVLYMQRPL